MDQEFNHAANDSPRSGSSKQVTPVVWGAIVACDRCDGDLVCHEAVSFRKRLSSRCRIRVAASAR